MHTPLCLLWGFCLQVQRLIEAFQQPFRREVGCRPALPATATDAVGAVWSVSSAATTTTAATAAGSVAASAAATTAAGGASALGTSSGGGKRHRSVAASTANDDAAPSMTTVHGMWQGPPVEGESSEPAGMLSRPSEEGGQGAELASMVTDAHGQQEEEEGEGEGEEGGGDELLYQATQMLASSSRPAAEGSDEDDTWGQDGDDEGT